MINLHSHFCAALFSVIVAAIPIRAADYILIGVSGGLQEGFPAHTKLHYNNNEGEQVKALFLGRGLVRGYKAFLDLMEPSWREYSNEPDQPVINSNVFASGCYEHANEYWLYLVDSRQVLSVLNNEPRFLSMTPDTGMIDLKAANGTFPLVRDFLTTHLQQRSSLSTSSSSPTPAVAIEKVAIPLVTCVYFQESSHIPSPPFYSLDDGTQVTNFPDSLALWANVNDSDRTAVLDTTKRCQSRTDGEESKCEPTIWVEAVKAEQRYWHGIRKAIRQAEANRPPKELVQLYSPPFSCQQNIRFGVGNEGDPENTSTPVNYPFTTEEVKTILNQIGYHPDFEGGEIIPMDSTTKFEDDTVPDL